MKSEGTYEGREGQKLVEGCWMAEVNEIQGCMAAVHMTQLSDRVYDLCVPL
jgi:hypothetical protein